MDNVKYIDVVIPMYNLIEYSNNYLKTSGSLWQCYKNDWNDNITQSESFRFKTITGNVPAAGNTKDFEIAVPLKYLTLKRLWFLKNVSCKERVKPWLFVTFNIIIRHIFPESFVEIPQVV